MGTACVLAGRFVITISQNATASYHAVRYVDMYMQNFPCLDLLYLAVSWPLWKLIHSDHTLVQLVAFFGKLKILASVSKHGLSMLCGYDQRINDERLTK